MPTETLHAFAGALATAAGIAALYMTAGFLYSLYRRRADIADTLWGIGFIVIASTLFFEYNFVPTLRQILVTVLVCVWGIRLARHVHARNKNKPEDFRYQAWREQWGRWFALRSYLQIFLLQGALMVLVSAPVIFIQRFDQSLLRIFTIDWAMIAGATVWVIGFWFESRGDAELKAFLADPANKGKILTTGLWAYTRHPNYFGEVAQWWGVFIIALGLSHGWLSVVGPATITFLILKVSGIPMLEKKYAGNPEFEAYKKRTSAFFPLPPKQ